METTRSHSKDGSPMDTSFPAFLHEDPCLYMSPEQFEQYISKLLPGPTRADSQQEATETPEVNQHHPTKPTTQNDADTSGDTFIDALDKTIARHKRIDSAELAPNNRALTDNFGVTFASTESSLVDLFHSLDGEWTETKQKELESLLDSSWKEDSLAYRETVTVGKVGSTLDDYDVVRGVSHGYWKDLLNLLALSASGRLDMTDPRKLLQTRFCVGYRLRKRKVQKEKPSGWQELSSEEKIKRSLERDQSVSREAKERRHAGENERHQRIMERLSNDPFHRALHMTVARLFSEKLQKDIELLRTGTKEQQKELSLCGKWAPSLQKFHDKHTRIATTIAEILFPRDKVAHPDDSREMYLKRAREQYRFWTTSKLRKALQCVECDISANTLSNINYGRVPSLAMDQYKKLFIKKDGERFGQYLVKVAEGKAKISGAILAPGSLVLQAKKYSSAGDSIKQSVVDLQWRTLVQRIKDCGSLTHSIAVSDVSGSMLQKTDDGKCTLMDTAIGLGLIVSETTEPPFGGKVITFSRDPQVLNIGGANDSRTFSEQVTALQRSEWGFNTDFLKVFKLILDIAVSSKVKSEDMVKRLFVFSDMQFDAARYTSDNWDTHHEIITKDFAAAGYEPPELVYWNLNGSDIRNVPVTKDMPGTALVSGNSQAMLKVFLETGSMDGQEEEEGVKEQIIQEEAKEDEDWDVVKKEKKMMTPYSLMMKAIGNKAFDMLTVVD
ncbi:hypothetical protein CPC735_066920 [Coccidioides posadasii C735 delta SOWgp]|uniref:DUF2828 domain-containing protein n=1 Tax=Coccidioides posadasii (strain C735) TaxID=222929 RepID=C5PCB5_COCP7|nr:hypothetical protein CPC735_066920 [Coccidioides posadasii C735 delta SOWgp]EER25592.1 hypothetical protein CPC735_066920 [Coccidioides posadasii C735 delta SOWgp]|eukprot:XP_003067737.1 hypothetical protein CPC735_066920 [Coccidioides posadasii C735 delta SOWgp]